MYNKIGGNMKKILIVEDEASISDLIKIELEYKGYKCDVASDGELACEYIDNKDYDLALLDVMVPKIDGYELLEYIKITKELPVIFITAKSQTKDKIKGLREGADDYITKPFEMEELVARIEVVLRRYNKASNIINIDNVEIDVLARAVKLNSEKVDLTPKEFDLLMLLAQNIGSALYRETIFEKVWGEELEFETRTLDLHIQRLRKKLNWKDKIKTVYRIGYMLEK